MTNILTQEEIDRYMKNVLPPGVDPMAILDDSDNNLDYFKKAAVLNGDDDWKSPLSPFYGTLVIAVFHVVEHDDNRLLEALRAKWPDDVERELPAIRRGVAAELSVADKQHVA